MDGKLQHSVYVQLSDDRFINAKVRDGVLHGPVLLLGVRLWMPLAEEYGEPTGYTESRVGMVAHFRSGRPVGPAWFQLLGKGFLYGHLDKDGR